MNHKLQVLKYLLSDLLSALLSWILFYQIAINRYYPGSNPFPFLSGNPDPFFIKGLLVFPLFWVLLYFLWGFYFEVFRKSRLKELGASITVTLSGTIILFMCLISMNIITNITENFFSAFTTLFYIHFLVSYFPRLAITSFTIFKIRKGIIGFNTLIIGSEEKAVSIYKEISAQARPTGNIFIGFINTNGSRSYPLAKYIKHLGGLESLSKIISANRIEEVIIATEPAENGKVEGIINRLIQNGIVIKAIPEMHDILTSRVRIDTIIETPLIKISHKLIPVWQSNLKYILDIVFSFFALILLLPLSLFIMIWIKLSSKGPAIHCHERIGKNGKPFIIYKFRTMIENAEKNGPELSSSDDKRITKPGRILRSMRLDEIPNFINVLKGDMSIVGPRPERRHYIDQIVKKAPHYNLLLKIKPGITSWGQVKYGYAENIEQMIQRLRYDMIYLDNMSVFVDFQILILTILTIFKRKGV